jgi:hypothetical protein
VRRGGGYLGQSLSLGILHERNLYWSRLLTCTSAASAAGGRLVGRGGRGRGVEGRARIHGRGRAGGGTGEGEGRKGMDCSGDRQR